jgi:hypothetical protein
MKYILIISFLLGFSVAWSKSVAPEKYLSKVHEIANQLVITRSSGVAVYTLRLVPGAVKVIHLFKNGRIDATQAKEMLEQSKTRYDFILNIEIPENGAREFMAFDNGRDAYDTKVKYYSFGFSEHIRFENSTKQWQKVTAYNFERDFGLSPKGTMLFSIPKSALGKDLKLEIHDQIFGLDAIYFDFDLKILQKLPKLKPVEKWNK